DRIGEAITFTAGERLEPDVAVPVLPMAARLLLVLALPLRDLADRLAVRDARLLGRDLYAVLALEPLDLDVQVQLAEPADDRLPDLRGVTESERRILLAQLGEPVADLVLIAAAGRADRHGDVRFRECDRREHERPVRRAQGIVRVCVLQLRDDPDVSPVQPRHLHPFPALR